MLPGLAQILDVAYLSLQPQLALVPLILLLAEQTLRLQQFVLSFGLALMATTLIASFVPAVAAQVYVDLAPLDAPAIPADVYTHTRTLHALRYGTIGAIRLDNLEGLITFPSFHTATGVLFAWALRQVPYARFAGICLNGLMTLSTPISGSHYIIDLMGGAL